MLYSVQMSSLFRAISGKTPCNAAKGSDDLYGSGVPLELTKELHAGFLFKCKQAARKEVTDLLVTLGTTDLFGLLSTF